MFGKAVRSRWFVAVSSVALTAAIVGGAAYAVIPNSSTGIISGCYKTTGTNAGALRVIDAQSGAVCLGTETPISWDSKKLNFRGAYSAVTAYAKNDIVTSGGSSYVALQANTGVPVTNTTNWAVLAKKGAAGAPGTPGVPGPPGPPGPSGIVATAGIAGYAGTIAPTAGYTFVGPAATVAVANGQRITSSVTVPLGVVAGSQLVYYDICYSFDNGVTLLLLNGANNYLIAPATATRASFAMSASQSFPVGGSALVGFCVFNPGPLSLDNNDWVSGFVQVTN